MSSLFQHVNDLSMNIPCEETLTTAESIYHQLAATQDKLPSHICDILGFNPYGSRSESPVPAHQTTPPLNTHGPGHCVRVKTKESSPGNLSSDVEVL